MRSITKIRCKAELALVNHSINTIEYDENFSDAINHNLLPYSSKKSEDSIRICQIYILAHLQGYISPNSPIHQKLLLASLQSLREFNQNDVFVNLFTANSCINGNDLGEADEYINKAQNTISTSEVLNADIMTLQLDILKFKYHRLMNTMDEAVLLAERIAATNHPCKEVQKIISWLDIQKSNYANVVKRIHQTYFHDNEETALLAEAYHHLNQPRSAFVTAAKFIMNDTSSNSTTRLKISEILIASQIENLKALLAEHNTERNEQYAKLLTTTNSIFTQKICDFNYGEQSHPQHSASLINKP